ncbi:MAG TPA: O-acetyl-ADP-ribose deacetylase [Bacteroidota bacterium]
MIDRLVIIQGDITTQNVDAVVNAANSSLLGGGGVDGAIHRAAGPQLLEECRTLGGCETGEAKMTKGYGLPARFVIHTVGPIWHGGRENEERLLAQCYRNSFGIARKHKLARIAFPSISTGIYGYPVEKASRIALREIAEELDKNPSLQEVRVVCFDDHTLQTYLDEVGKFAK